MRVAADLEPIEIERGAEVFDLQRGGLGLGAAEEFHHLRADQAGEQAEDGEHHQELNQGEAARFVGVLSVGFEHASSLRELSPPFNALKIYNPDTLDDKLYSEEFQQRIAR